MLKKLSLDMVLSMKLFLISYLNPIEQAKAYKYLKENLDSSITEIAKTIGKSRPAVSNILSLYS